MSAGATIAAASPGAWRLRIPAGQSGYRLAQLDNYHHRGRRAFPHRAPFRLQLRARAGAEEIPGTWGFGLWNDPFGMGLALEGPRLRLPALPNTAWFFFASPPNYLSLRDDLPAQGALVGTFRSPRLPTPLLAPAAPSLALLAFPPAARLLRRLARPVVRQASVALEIDPIAWHAYTIEWRADRAQFYVDGVLALDTPLSPHGPLGLVIWIDNQYMSFPSNGRARFGVLDSAVSHWIEIADLEE